MKVNAKIHKTYNYLIRLLIIAATYGVLYSQVFYKRNLDEIYYTFLDFFSSALFRRGLILLLAMMLVNWMLESLKWQILIARIEKVSLWKSFRAVLSGISVSIFLPNRTGEFLGRVFILEKANRVEGALITIIGSISQLLITISIGLFGFIAFFFQYLKKDTALHDYLGAGIILLIPIIVFLLLLLYFNMGSVTPILVRMLRGRWKKYTGYAEVFARYNARDLFRVLLLSFLRYIVFSAQFYLLLLLFNLAIPYPEAIILISMVYLMMLVLPTFAMTELGIRGSLSVYIFSFYFIQMGASQDTSQLGVFAASSLLWLINIVLPALAGTVFVFNLKFFRK
jgi:uncharacterized membrane protein YbhN (UPF0104 family)